MEELDAQDYFLLNTVVNCTSGPHCTVQCEVDITAMPCLCATWPTCKHAMHMTQKECMGQSCKLCICALEQGGKRTGAWGGG